MENAIIFYVVVNTLFIIFAVKRDIKTSKQQEKIVDYQMNYKLILETKVRNLQTKLKIAEDIINKDVN